MFEDGARRREDEAMLRELAGDCEYGDGKSEWGQARSVARKRIRAMDMATLDMMTAAARLAQRIGMVRVLDALAELARAKRIDPERLRAWLAALEGRGGSGG